MMGSDDNGLSNFQITGITGESLRVGDYITIDMSEWNNCPIEGCSHKVCRALKSNYCFPHTPGYAWVKRRRIEIIQLCHRIIEWCEE